MKKNTPYYTQKHSSSTRTTCGTRSKAESLHVSFQKANILSNGANKAMKTAKMYRNNNNKKHQPTFPGKQQRKSSLAKTSRNIVTAALTI